MSQLELEFFLLVALSFVPALTLFGLWIGIRRLCRWFGS